ncbi:MAG: bis-aminopropyl spermidine synthase family protein [Candidatus Hydrothermarchaeota archaeon]
MKTIREMGVTRMRYVREILRALLKKDLDIWEIASFSAVPMRELTKTLKILRKNGYVDENNYRFSLTKEGENFAEELGVKEVGDKVCPECDGRGIAIDDDFLKEFEEISRNRPYNVPEYDQSFITTDSTIARVLFMLNYGDIDGKNIIVLGDDDLVSIAIAMTGLAKKVTAIDIDERILEFINDQELGIKTIRFDLRDPIPRDLRDKFDCFTTDPPDTAIALTLFVCRGLECLKEEGSGYFSMTFTDAPLSRWYFVEKSLMDMGFVVTDIRRNFSTYELYPEIAKLYRGEGVSEEVPEPTKRWYKSNLFRIELIKDKNIIYEERVDGDLYDYMEGP